MKSKCVLRLKLERKMERLTVTEAIEKGFTHFGYSDQGYQSMKDISDFNPNKSTGKECLFSNESTSPCTSAENIRELIADDVECNWDSETSDDTCEVQRAIMSIPLSFFEGVVAEINLRLSEKNYYSLTEISLIPDRLPVDDEQPNN